MGMPTSEVSLARTLDKAGYGSGRNGINNWSLPGLKDFCRKKSTSKIIHGLLLFRVGHMVNISLSVQVWRTIKST